MASENDFTLHYRLYDSADQFLGVRQFATAPRIGEHILLGNKDLYKVTEVIHRAPGSSTHAGFVRLGLADSALAGFIATAITK